MAIDIGLYTQWWDRRGWLPPQRVQGLLKKPWRIRLIDDFGVLFEQCGKQRTTTDQHNQGHQQGKSWSQYSLHSRLPLFTECVKFLFYDLLWLFFYHRFEYQTSATRFHTKTHSQDTWYPDCRSQEAYSVAVVQTNSGRKAVGAPLSKTISMTKLFVSHWWLGQ